MYAGAPGDEVLTVRPLAVAYTPSIVPKDVSLPLCQKYEHNGVIYTCESKADVRSWGISDCDHVGHGMSRSSGEGVVRHIDGLDLEVQVQCGCIWIRQRCVVWERGVYGNQQGRRHGEVGSC